MEQQRLLERLNSHPLYINKNPRMTVKSSDRVRVSLPNVAVIELGLYGNNYDLDGLSEDDLEFFSTFALNGIKVRTKDSEIGLKTRDSIVCGRFKVDGDSSSSSSSDSDMSDTDSDCDTSDSDVDRKMEKKVERRKERRQEKKKERKEEVFFGQVLYIAKLDEDILVNVNWFQTNRTDEVTEDERNGLAPVRVVIGRTRPMNNWISASSFAFQQHILVGYIINGNICHIICKD